MNFKENLKKFFTTRTVGFWIALAAAVIALVEAIVYVSAFGEDVERMSTAAFALALVGAIAFLGLSVSKHTAPYSAAALGVCTFIAFLQFVSHQIIYLSDVFYGGVNAAAFAALDGGFLSCTVLLVLAIGLSVAGIFMKQYKTENTNENE